MDYKQLIDKLVRELSYRVGVPNIHDKEHQSIISEILTEWGEFEAKQTIFEFLTEKDDEKIDPETEITYQNKKGETRKTTYKTAIASNQDSPQFKAADSLRNKKNKDGSTDKPSPGKVAGKKMFQHAPDINPNVGKSDSDIQSKPDTSTFEVGSKRSTEKIIKVNEKLSDNLKFIEENYDKVRLKTGGGSNSPSVQDVKDLKEFTEKRMAQDRRRKEALEKGEEFNEEPYVHPSIIQRNVTDDEVDTAMDYFEEKLEPSDFGKLLKKFSAGGAVPRHLTKITKLKKGDEGYPGIDKSSPGYIRAKKILKLYLKNDCKSPVTGNPLPLSHMEPDHRLPFTTAESDIVESGKYEGLSLKAKKPADGNSLQEIMKKRKEELSEREQNIVKDLEPLQAKYDDPDTNMDLMSGPVNQFKSDLIDNDLLNSIRRKLAENPEEKKLQNEYKTLRKKLIREHHADKVSRGDNPPYNEYGIRNADSTETNAIMKAHNFYHPDAKTITELEGGDPSKGIPADPQYYDKVKAFWKEKGVELPENKEDIDFKQEPFNKTLTVYVQAGRSRGGAKRRSKGQDHEYLIEEFKKFGYFGSSLEDDKNQEEVIDEARKEMNKQLDTKRIEILKVQLADPNIQGKKRENRQKELNDLVAIYGEN
tara:strand:+ start:714 stop:2654 length:1941 start_codon:yes stop_codon:yes gene_type:complete